MIKQYPPDRPPPTDPPSEEASMRFCLAFRHDVAENAAVIIYQGQEVWIRDVDLVQNPRIEEYIRWEWLAIQALFKSMEAESYCCD